MTHSYVLTHSNVLTHTRNILSGEGRCSVGLPSQQSLRWPVETPGTDCGGTAPSSNTCRSSNSCQSSNTVVGPPALLSKKTVFLTCPVSHGRSPVYVDDNYIYVIWWRWFRRRSAPGATVYTPPALRVWKYLKTNSLRLVSKSATIALDIFEHFTTPPKEIATAFPAVC